MRYEIKGETLPVVICHLEDGEKMVTERGAMSWMSPNMRMESGARGGIGKAFGRMFSGDSIFQNVYTAEHGNGMIAFASSFPGSIKAFEVGPGQEYILQKSAFLASEAGVELSIHFQKKVASGLFGGEGFIMQRVSGQGIVFAEFDGHVVEYELRADQQIVIIPDTWLQCRLPAESRFRPSLALKIWYLEEKACLTRWLRDRDMSGFRRCR